MSTVQNLVVDEKLGNCIPVFIELPADLLTPCAAYLRIAKDSKYSFLLESVASSHADRYCFIGAGKSPLVTFVESGVYPPPLPDPFKVLKTGLGHETTGDPMRVLEQELNNYRYVKIPEVPTFTGGAIGYVSYDAIQHFEPKTARPLKDTLQIPEAVFMFVDTLLIYDNVFQTLKVVSHVFCPDNTPTDNLTFIYNTAVAKVRRLAKVILSPTTPEVPQPPIRLGHEAVSNVGQSGYESFVTHLKKRIVAGDIIQAVPSQRLTRTTDLHPFNAYRRLRQVNPSPYMFYLNCGECQIVGSSPETLCKVEDGKVFNHAIAGTIKRGRTREGMLPLLPSFRGRRLTHTVVAEDEAFAAELLASEKDRAEHIMLVDLARNDVNRSCQPTTVKVDHLMTVEKFSHVQHLTSQVTGLLREDKTRYLALGSLIWHTYANQNRTGSMLSVPSSPLELSQELQRSKPLS